MRSTTDPQLIIRIAITVLLPMLVLAPNCGGQQVAPQLTLSINDEDGLVRTGHAVTINATVINRSEVPLSGELEWHVHTVAFAPPLSDPVEFAIDLGETRTFSFEIALPVRGFADVECKLIESGAKTSSAAKRTRIGSRPEEIDVPLTRQSDFHEFWKDSLAELAAIPPEFQIARQETDKEMELFEVSMKSHGGVCVRGWLEVPNAAGPHPVVIRVPGYGQNMRPISRWDDMIVFSFNPRGHGNSQDDVPGKPVNYWIRGLDDKNGYYYRGAYLDCLRAVDFIASRADVDQDRIAVWGGSQGGGFAFATASLDRRIDLCAADIPFLCDWVNYFKLTRWPEMDGWITAKPERTWTSTLKTLSYFDTMNLADRIQCPTLMGVGLQDQVCPPTTSFAAFNRIAGPKSFKMYVNQGHGLGRDHYSRVWNWIRESFEMPPRP
jgi:cephalosporin-C deacetylase